MMDEFLLREIEEAWRKIGELMPTLRTSWQERDAATAEVKRLQTLYLDQGPVDTTAKLTADRDLLAANLASFVALRDALEVCRSHAWWGDASRETVFLLEKDWTPLCALLDAIKPSDA